MQVTNSPSVPNANTTSDRAQVYNRPHAGHEAADRFSQFTQAVALHRVVPFQEDASTIPGFQPKRHDAPPMVEQDRDVTRKARSVSVLTQAPNASSEQAPPAGIMAVIKIVRQWVREGRNADLVRIIGRPELNDADYLRFMDAVVTDLKRNGQYEAMAAAALDRLERDGAYATEVERIRGLHPDKDGAWINEKARASLSEWADLNLEQKAGLFNLLLDPECAAEVEEAVAQSAETPQTSEPSNVQTAPETTGPSAMPAAA